MVAQPQGRRQAFPMELQRVESKLVARKQAESKPADLKAPESKGVGLKPAESQLEASMFRSGLVRYPAGLGREQAPAR